MDVVVDVDFDLLVLRIVTDETGVVDFLDFWILSDLLGVILEALGFDICVEVDVYLNEYFTR